MDNETGLVVSLRARVTSSFARSPAGIADPSFLIALFSDAAAELMIRLDGDEGVLRAFQQLEINAPIVPGDFVEVSAAVTKVGATSRQVVFEVRKTIGALRTPQGPSTAADPLSEPIVVARAIANCIVPKARQRRPRTALPALPGPSSQHSDALPAARTVVTPPPSVIITPPRRTHPEVMIFASIVGGGVTRDHTPHIPTTAEEAAAEAKRCRDAGACGVSLSLAADQLDLARDMVSAIRAATDLLVVVEPIQIGSIEPEMLAAWAGLDADLVALPGGSSNIGDSVVTASAPTVRNCLASIADAKPRPIIACSELGHLASAVAMSADRVVTGPLRLQFTLGIPGAMGAGDDILRAIAAVTPATCIWFAAGVGRHQRRITENAIRLGAHVRLGLGDNIYLRKGVLAEGSAPFVERTVAFSTSIGRTPCSAERAAKLLMLASSDQPASPPAGGPNDDGSPTT